MNCAFAVLAVVVTSASCTDGPVSPDPPPGGAPLVIVDEAGRLAAGYDLQVNTSGGRTDWLLPTSDGLQAAYPSGQAWGFVGAVLMGSSTLGSRPGRDLSQYRMLQLQLRGLAGGESVDVGIKDSTDPDNGTETKKNVRLTTSWQTFNFALTDFTSLNRSQVYLVFELVFDGGPSRSIAFRDVKFMP